MGYQQIMTPFLEARSSERSFSASLVFAKEFKAHIDVVHMRQRPGIPTTSYVPYPPAYIPENYEQVKEAMEKTAMELEGQLGDLCSKHDATILDRSDHTAAEGVTASWRDVDGYLPFDLTAKARLADVIVVAKPDKDSPFYENGLIEEFIFQSGRPIVIADKITAFPETIIVAWNGSREAARALGAALPVLKRAGKVIVASVGDSFFGAEPPESAACYLKLHGVHATHVQLEHEKKEDSEKTFLQFARKESADLIVMGAYSHSRWREVILGGFTRYLLNNSDIPLFVAH